jgi:ribonuclease/clavin/mitogillin
VKHAHDLRYSILTHRHHDHVGGLPSVLQLISKLQSDPPRLHKYPEADTDEALFTTLKSLPDDTYTKHSTSPIRPLEEGDAISVGEGADKATLKVVHSPGHTKDHICLFFQQEHALLTGDHVLGQGTSVFEDLGSYLKSLRKCHKLLEEDSPSEERRLYPGHGPIIDTGKKALKEYLTHRLEREDQILALLASSPSSEDGGNNDSWTIKSIVSKLYSNYPEHLYPAAARGIFLHLQKLALPDQEAIERGIVGQENQGRRVLCVGTVAGKDGTAPETPKVDKDWLQIMELQWRLLKTENTKESL